MQEITLKNWTAFLKITESLDIGSAGLMPVLYRGQAKATRDLSPSLQRLFSESTTAVQALVIEDRLLERFNEQVHLHLPQVQLPNKNDLLVGWALMQHYGAPTRMLDWTASPFVAAYFASLNHWEDDGAIWVIHRNSVDSSAQDESLSVTAASMVSLVGRFKDPNAPPHFFPVRQSLPTDRVVAQQGWFTVSPQILANHGEILGQLKPIEKGGDPPALKLIVPGHLKSTFLRRLRTMNVTASVLFPGIDGLGRSVDELARIMAAEVGSKTV